MDKKTINRSRRTIINRSLSFGALGAMVPNQWTKPIVSAVMLPAHAMTSVSSFSVEKTQSGGPNPATAEGDIIEYTIVVTNTGDFSLTEIVATDTLPDGTVIVLSGAVESAASDGILEVGESWTYETTYTVSLEDVVAGENLTNVVSVEVAEIQGSQTDEVDTPVVAVPSFSVEKTQSGGPNPAMLVGDELEYTIVITNTGDLPLTDVVTTDTLPDGSVVVLSGQIESLASDEILEIDETWTYQTTYTVTLDDVAAAADLTNAVSVEVAELPNPETDQVDTPVEPIVCPDIIVDNAVLSDQGSGDVNCSLSFDVFSSESTPLTISNITNTALSIDAQVVYESFPVDVTNMGGTRVTWTGSFGTPECRNAFASDVVFTVTATCEGAIDSVTMDFNLADIAAMA